MFCLFGVVFVFFVFFFFFRFFFFSSSSTILIERWPPLNCRYLHLVLSQASSSAPFDDVGMGCEI